MNNVFLSTAPPMLTNVRDEENMLTTQTALRDFAYIAYKKFNIVHIYDPSITYMLLAIAESFDSSKESDRLKIITIAHETDLEGDMFENLIVVRSNAQAKEDYVRQIALGQKPESDEGKKLNQLMDGTGYESAVFIGGDQNTIKDFDQFVENFPGLPIYVFPSTGGACVQLIDRVQIQGDQRKDMLCENLCFVESFDRLFPARLY